MARKSNNANNSNILTADFIRQVSENAPVRKAKVDLLGDGKQTGVIHYVSVDAASMRRFLQTQGNADHLAGAVKLLSESLVNPDGSPLFTEEEIWNLKSDIIMNVMTAVIEARGTEGNA